MAIPTMAPLAPAASPSARIYGGEKPAKEAAGTVGAAVAAAARASGAGAPRACALASRRSPPGSGLAPGPALLKGAARLMSQLTPSGDVMRIICWGGGGGGEGGQVNKEAH